MKESRFIELLNLYLDHQISQEGAALLEEEILQNPGRRRTYNQYCRMQRACSLVLDQFNAPAGRARRGAGRIVGFESAERWPRWGYYAAGLAAAAGIALVAMQGRLHSGGNPAQVPLPAAPPTDASLVSSASIGTTGPLRLAAPAARLPAYTELFIDERLRVISPISTSAGLPVVLANTPRLPVPLSLPEVPPTPRSVRPSIEQFVFAAEPLNLNTPKIFRHRQQTDEEALQAALEYHR
jgi:hypothetical protein